ncbi:MAG TPA: hypothetical protein VM870_00895 [Pyrinomonadaceae bacterium]|nr:hypothetical protein [Pyrinomonadaceae bacterium]
MTTPRRVQGWAGGGGRAFAANLPDVFPAALSTARGFLLYCVLASVLPAKMRTAFDAPSYNGNGAGAGLFVAAIAKSVDVSERR